VKEQRWPWLLTAVLMLASAVAAAWATYLQAEASQPRCCI
jgi:hypothetical protein